MKTYHSITKKITNEPVNFLKLILLIMMTATASIAQPPPPPPGPPQAFFYPYTESFNSFVSLVPIQYQGIWSGGISGLMSYQEHGLNGTMGMSINTISTYRARILEKLQLKNNAALTRYALDNVLV